MKKMKVTRYYTISRPQQRTHDDGLSLSSSLFTFNTSEWWETHETYYSQYILYIIKYMSCIEQRVFWSSFLLFTTYSEKSQVVYFVKWTAAWFLANFLEPLYITSQDIPLNNIPPSHSLLLLVPMVYYNKYFTIKVIYLMDYAYCYIVINNFYI
jgi:hypothetical protein